MKWHQKIDIHLNLKIQPKLKPQSPTPTDLVL